jgi:hypothetical protein
LIVDIHLTARDDRPDQWLTRERVLEVLRAAGITPKDDGVVSDGPVVMWEIGVDDDEYIICQERDGKVMHLTLESPSERLESRVCRAFRRLGWQEGSD